MGLAYGIGSAARADGGGGGIALEHARRIWRKVLAGKRGMWRRLRQQIHELSNRQ
jgi:hypothetical protein